MNTSTAPAARTFTGPGRVAIVAALYTYGVIIIAGLVRITRARDLPLAQFLNGVLAAGFLLVAAALITSALRRRANPGFAGPRSVFRALIAAGVGAALLAVLDGIVYRVQPTPTLHAAQYLLALLILAALLLAAVRAGVLGGGRTALSSPADARRAARMAVGTAGFGFLVVTLGVLTAVTPASPQACLGFPLCNGDLLPRADAPTHVHWTHRMLAFLFFFHLVGAFFGARKRAASAATLRAALVTLVTAVLQVLVAGALMGMNLAPALQVLHLVAGASLWAALVAWAALARRDQHALA